MDMCSHHVWSLRHFCWRTALETLLESRAPRVVFTVCSILLSMWYVQMFESHHKLCSARWSRNTTVNCYSIVQWILQYPVHRYSLAVAHMKNLRWYFAFQENERLHGVNVLRDISSFMIKTLTGILKLLSFTLDDHIKIRCSSDVNPTNIFIHT